MVCLTNYDLNVIIKSKAWGEANGKHNQLSIWNKVISY